MNPPSVQTCDPILAYSLLLNAVLFIGIGIYFLRQWWKQRQTDIQWAALCKDCWDCGKEIR